MALLLKKRYCFFIVFLMRFISFAWASPEGMAISPSLFQWAQQPSYEMQQVKSADARLREAIANPEYMLTHWICLPTAPKPKSSKTYFLSLKEAILLALRYNPNIQSAELDRIVQRYQLRLAENEFELQYALAGSTLIENNRFSRVGNTITHNTIGSPEINYRTPYGGTLALRMENHVASRGNYNPLMSFNIKQPLLRGFGKEVNLASLLNAKDNEWLNQLNLKQSISDDITQVIMKYRALIVSGNNYQNESWQLKEAKKTYGINEKKIAAGQLEPTANIQQSYQVESLNLMVEQAHNDFQTALQDLLQSIGLDPDLKLAVPSDVTIKTLAIPDLKASIEKGLRHNAQYQALKMIVRADERAYKIAKNQQLWQLDLSANVQTGQINDIDTTSKGVLSIFNGRNIIESAGLRLVVPLRDLNRRNELITAKVRLEKDKLQLLSAKRALITSITNIINAIESQAKRYELANRQVRLAAKSYELEKKKQSAGIASSLDVHNTQNKLLQAQNGLINAKIAYLNQLSALQTILGTTLEIWQIKLRFGDE